MRVELSELALDDLQQLDELYARSGGTGHEPSGLVLAAAEHLASFPLMGAIHHDAVLAQRGFRKLLAGNYVAVYRVDGRRVVIYRVFDQRSNYAAHM